MLLAIFPHRICCCNAIVASQILTVAAVLWYLPLIVIYLLRFHECEGFPIMYVLIAILFFVLELVVLAMLMIANC
ncbi:hypothetical protein PMAYCL1PPCAC_08470, partial [Pristionchus mayeri]